MEDKNQIPQEPEEFFGESLADMEEIPEDMPELELEPVIDELLAEDALAEEELPDDMLLEEALLEEDAYLTEEFSEEDLLSEEITDETTVFDTDTLESIAYGDHNSQDGEEDLSLASVFDDDQEFAEMFEGTDSEVTEDSSNSSRPARKGRPKRKKGDGLLGIPHLLATFVWLAIIVMIGVSLGRMVWVCAADVLAFGRESKEVTVTISKTDTIDDIAKILKDKGLIRYPGLFKIYSDISGAEEDIFPGTYTLNTILDYHALVGQMSPRSSSRAVISDVLIPEGYNCRQIFELLEEKGICSVEELEEYAANGEFADFWFLEGLERGDKYCLEGYLFPDTYDFYAGSTPREALGKMLLGFEARFTEDLYNQLPALNERFSKMMKNKGLSDEYIAEHQIGLHELLTIASLIEEETASITESPNIASVIFNRLSSKNEWERYLGIDATIIYALGEHKEALTAEDLAIDSPYNTRTHAGLVPGPISNPGLSSINAALNFADTNYYYYVLNPETGTHQFSKTYEEHLEWVEKFRGGDE